MSDLRTDLHETLEPLPDEVVEAFGQWFLAKAGGLEPNYDGATFRLLGRVILEYLEERRARRPETVPQRH